MSALPWRCPATHSLAARSLAGQLTRDPTCTLAATDSTLRAHLTAPDTWQRLTAPGQLLGSSWQLLAALGQLMAAPSISKSEIRQPSDQAEPGTTSPLRLPPLPKNIASGSLCNVQRGH